METRAKPNLIMDKSLEFSSKILNLYSFLTWKNEFIISKQLLRSGTSIGANITESKFASSKKDFLHKITIALKEANETFYWINLLDKTKMFDWDYKEYLHESNEIIAILAKIAKTTKDNIITEKQKKQ
jgi:four helix bundle protein